MYRYEKSGVVHGLTRVRGLTMDDAHIFTTREAMGDAVPFAAAEAWGERVLRPLIAMPASPRLLFNVNFPAIDPDRIKGVRVVRQGFHDVDRTKIIEGTDPRGYRYYWFGLGRSDSAPEGTDLAAIAEDYIAVTPLHYDLTQDGALAATAQAFSD